MRIRLGKLRQLVKEAGAARQVGKTHTIVQLVAGLAERYVDSVVAGHPDGTAAKELQSQADEFAGYAKWLLNHREAGAENVAMVAKYALDIAHEAGFWQRPTFLGKSEYVEKLQALLKRMQKFQYMVS
jgi:hypothetical protein